MKRALVVDDSPTARLALKQLLEQHGLAVELAASGEESLELLRHVPVDVIFMDHTIPGMDGLEVVAAIKREPRTALIPVMMYTTKEGEWYVGQARALGAIGVLPKEVHPQVLFDLLVSLGLVSERRTENRAGDATGPRRRASDLPTAEQTPPAGIALEPLLQRIVLDQEAFREELRTTQRELSRRMAAVVEATAGVRTEAPVRASANVAPAPQAVPAASSAASWKLATVALAVIALALAALFLRMRSERDAAIASGGDVSEAALLVASESHDLKGELRAAMVEMRRHDRVLIDALQWALNRNGSFPFDEVAFNAERAEVLREVLTQLVALGFRGRVRVEAHLGEFCLSADDAGGYRLAAPDLPVEACDRVGALNESPTAAEQQSVEFANFVETSPLLRGSGIELELLAYDRDHSLRRQAFPDDVAFARDWNRIAESNNRVEYSFIVESEE